MTDTTTPYITLRNFFDTGKKTTQSKAKRERHRSWYFQFDTDEVEDFARSSVTYLYIGRRGLIGSGIVRFNFGKSYGSALVTLGIKVHHLMPILSHEEFINTLQDIDSEYSDILSFGTLPQMGCRTDLSAERSPIYHAMMAHNNKRKLEQDAYNVDINEALRVAKRIKFNK